MDSRSLVGIVTVTYKSGGVIDDFLKSIVQQTYVDFNLYVVDNASSDDTLERVRGCSDPRIFIVPNQLNLGVAEGNNIGIRAALKDGCGFILLINNDTVFGSDLVSKLVEGIRQYDCDMAVPKILFFDQPKRIWCAGGSLSRLRGSAINFGLNQEDNGGFDRARQVDYSPTCCMLVKREVFERVGMMDANYFVYFDDTDFCWRAHRAGIRLFYVPSVRLFHKVSGLTGSESDFTIRHLIRNHVYYLLKNSPRWQALFYLPAFQLQILIRCMLGLTRLGVFLVTEKAFFEGIRLFLHSRRKGNTSFRSEPSASSNVKLLRPDR